MVHHHSPGRAAIGDVADAVDRAVLLVSLAAILRAMRPLVAVLVRGVVRLGAGVPRGLLVTHHLIGLPVVLGLVAPLFVEWAIPAVSRRGRRALATMCAQHQYLAPPNPAWDM